MTKKRKRKIAIKKMDKECWSLDRSFINWLEPRLKLYVARGGKVVNLNYHQIEVGGISRTQLEWINEMIVLCDLIRYEEDHVQDYGNDMIKLGHIWAELMPYMWW